MSKENLYQNDFFDNIRADKKKIKRRKTGIINNTWLRVTLSYEKIVLLIITAILFLSFIFSLGVERGKKIAGEYKTKNVNIVDKNKAFSIKEKNEAIKEEIIAVQPIIVSKLPSNDGEDIEIKEQGDGDRGVVDTKTTPYYTIQVVTYTKPGLAIEEKDNLVKQKYNAFIIKSGKYYQVCVGKYIIKDSAKKDLNVFRKKYNDCFVKKVN